jgi:hypothetical protein
MMKTHRVLNWVHGILTGKFDGKVIDLPFCLDSRLCLEQKNIAEMAVGDGGTNFSWEEM